MSGLADTMKGKIDLETETGKGVNFTIILPYSGDDSN
jgi:chemotaxis protein histidine kinase CheA